MLQNEWWLQSVLKRMTIPGAHGHVIMIWALGNWFSFLTVAVSQDHVNTFCELICRLLTRGSMGKPVGKVTSHSGKSSPLAVSPSAVAHSLADLLSLTHSPPPSSSHPKSHHVSTTSVLPPIHPCTCFLSLTALMLCFCSHSGSFPGHLCIFTYLSRSPSGPTILVPCLLC